MAALIRLLFFVTLTFLALTQDHAYGNIAGKTQRKINRANKYGPYIGIVIPSQFEMNPLLQHPSYSPSTSISLPDIEFAGKKFRFGTIANQSVILVMSGSSMLNSGITTQLLVSLFRLKGVVHYGVAGNAHPSLNIGDVIIPRDWSHTGLWSWQRYGKGGDDELPFEGNGDYTRDYGYLRFAKYATNVSGCSENDNLLNNIWYQPEEIFPVDGTPEQRQHIFWVRTNKKYFGYIYKIQLTPLENCINSTTCLPTTPRVRAGGRGTSANIFLDNAAYRTFLRHKFNVAPVDMESAAVALVCYQQNVPFIIFRGLSNLAGGGSASFDEGDTFSELAMKNTVTVVVEFIKKVISIIDPPPALVSESEVEEVLSM